MNDWAQLAQDLVNAALRIADAAERIAQGLDDLEQQRASRLAIALRESRRDPESAGD